MHGLVLRAAQLFVTDVYGSDRWSEVMEKAGLEFDEFEAMLDYETSVGEATIATLPDVLDRPLSGILEDVGIYLSSHPNVEVLRRLLRFGGVTFVEFLHSLDELPDRARLAVPTLELPRLELREHTSNYFSLTCHGNAFGFSHVLAGVVRTMADDYGVLAMVEHQEDREVRATLSIRLLEVAFAEGRDFDLGAQVG